MRILVVFLICNLSILLLVGCTGGTESVTANGAENVDGSGGNNDADAEVEVPEAMAVRYEGVQDLGWGTNGSHSVSMQVSNANNSFPRHNTVGDNLYVAQDGHTAAPSGHLEVNQVDAKNGSLNLGYTPILYWQSNTLFDDPKASYLPSTGKTLVATTVYLSSDSSTYTPYSSLLKFDSSGSVVWNTVRSNTNLLAGDSASSMVGYSGLHKVGNDHYWVASVSPRVSCELKIMVIDSVGVEADRSPFFCDNIVNSFVREGFLYLVSYTQGTDSVYSLSRMDLSGVGALSQDPFFGDKDFSAKIHDISLDRESNVYVLAGGELYKLEADWNFDSGWRFGGTGQFGGQVIALKVVEDEILIVRKLNSSEYVLEHRDNEGGLIIESLNSGVYDLTSHIGWHTTNTFAFASIQLVEDLLLVQPPYYTSWLLAIR